MLNFSRQAYNEKVTDCHALFRILRFFELGFFLGRNIDLGAELQKCANRANQLVLFFLAGANFWEKHEKNRRKHAKTGENTRKQALFWC